MERLGLAGALLFCGCIELSATHDLGQPVKESQTLARHYSGSSSFQPSSRNAART